MMLQDPNEVFVQPNGSTEEYAAKAVSALAVGQVRGGSSYYTALTPRC